MCMRIYVTLFMDVHLRSAVRWECQCTWICFERVKGWSCCLASTSGDITVRRQQLCFVFLLPGTGVHKLRESGCLLIFVGSWVWNWLHVTLLSPRILRWLLDFWKIYGALSLKWIRGHRVSCLWRSEGCSLWFAELLWCLCVCVKRTKMEKVTK
jgi:hypothetical protein